MTLADLVTTNMEDLPVETIALLVAREKYKDLDLSTYHGRFDEFARRASVRVGKVVGGRQIAEGLGHYLFEEEGFTGNQQDYYNPSNSYLNDVLDNREGTPLTLSIVYLAVAKRLQLPVSGVGFPGHFLVRYDDPAETFFVDPFHKGQLLNLFDCQQLLWKTHENTLPFRPEYLLPVNNRHILLRMLMNLKACYIMKNDLQMAIQFLNRVMLFEPNVVDEIKERGMLYYQMECFGQALHDLTIYLKKNPNSPERAQLEKFIQDLTHKVELIQ